MQYTRYFVKYKLSNKVLHAVLEADEGPELDINIGGVLETRLVVRPIKEAFGIPVVNIIKCNA